MFLMFLFLFLFLFLFCFSPINGFVLQNNKKTNPFLFNKNPYRLSHSNIIRYSIETNICDEMIQSSDFLFTLFSIQSFLYAIIFMEKFNAWIKS